MSIIIKGMKMPKNCNECIFHSIEDEFFDTVHECEVKKNYIIKTDIYEIPPDCPLVELPEKHGRLIDADDCFKYMTTNNAPAWEVLKYAPTFIEAEVQE